MILRCPECQVPLTRELTALADPALLCTADGEPYLPEGNYHREPAANHYLKTTGDVVAVNLADVLNTKHSTDPRRLNGCCGLDGCDGLNLLCINGHAVGTEKSDCWMAHAALFEARTLPTP